MDQPPLQECLSWNLDVFIGHSPLNILLYLVVPFPISCQLFLDPVPFDEILSLVTVRWDNDIAAINNIVRLRGGEYETKAIRSRACIISD